MKPNKYVYKIIGWALIFLGFYMSKVGMEKPFNPALALTGSAIVFIGRLIDVYGKEWLG